MAKLRVLFLATRDYKNPSVAGGDINMWESARFLAFRGHTVTFLASSFAGARKQEMVDGVQIVRLGARLSLWLRTFIYYIRQGRGRYDVVVAEGFGGSRIPRLAPLYVREPMLTEWRQIHRELFAAQYPRFAVPALNLFERATAFVHRNTNVLAYTPEGKKAFAEIGFKDANVVVVPVSIRDEWLKNGHAASGTEPTIIWLGKFRRYKCPHHIVLAMPEIVRTAPNTKLLLAGRHDDTRYERELRALVKRYSLDSSVEFLFDLSEEEKRSALKRSRVLVVPSAVEGFGIVVLEANACGVPVVASSGVPESVVTEGRNGLRYSFGDLSGLARQVIRILTDDQLFSRLSETTKQFVSDFEWKRVGTRYEEVISYLADGTLR